MDTPTINCYHCAADQTSHTTARNATNRSRVSQSQCHDSLLTDSSTCSNSHEHTHRLRHDRHRHTYRYNHPRYDKHHRQQQQQHHPHHHNPQQKQRGTYSAIRHHPPLLAVTLLYTLLLLPAPTTAIPEPLTCRYRLSHTLANCSSRDLQDVPYGLHNNILIFDLSSNNFRQLANQSFLGYDYINHLYLRNNSLSEIASGALNNLNYLQTLDLSNNKLNTVPVAALNPVAHGLVELYLAGNYIYQIPRGAFTNMNKLKHLDLSGNSIFKVEAGAFRGLVELQVLKLRHNALTTLPADSFIDLPANIQQVQLYDNRWFCDCRLRWLRLWMNSTEPGVWNSTGYHVRCDGPSVVRDANLDTRPLDELACEVQMKTSGATRELEEGADTTLLCKYSSVPSVEAKWLRNSEIIDAAVTSRDGSGGNPDMSFNGPPAAIAAVAPIPTPGSVTAPSARRGGKFHVETWTTVGYSGDTIQISQLHIRDFQYDDIARYECFVQNVRGGAATGYRLTLKGVAFDSVTSSLPSGQVSKGASGGGVDTRSIVIAVAVVCVLVLVVALTVLVLCSVSRIQRRRREKRQAIEETVKQHFIENSEMASNGDAIKSLEDNGIDARDGADPDRSFSTAATHSLGRDPLKRPLRLSSRGDTTEDEMEPPYIFQQPGSPFNNGNTYVSFGSELTDPGEFTSVMPPVGTLPRGGGPGSTHPANHPSSAPSRHLSSSRGYESSHAGSGTPLLDRATPSVHDSDDPIEDYAQYPVYDSLTNTLHRPNGETSSVYGGSLHRGGGVDGIYGGSVHNGDAIYNGSLHRGGPGNGIYGGPPQRAVDGIYGGSLQHYPATERDTDIYGGSVRGGNYMPGSPYTRAPSAGPRVGDPSKRLSSFHYPHPRPSSTLPAPIPRYADSTPRLDRLPYHPQAPSSPGRHPDYRDYREVSYHPAPLPSPMGGGHKSMSVGNLGHHHYYTPAPRKPPRVFQSREYLELTPSEPPTPHSTDSYTNYNANGSYITSPEAQKYSTSHGITPGTPV